MSLVLRYMQSRDVTQVVQIDGMSFDPPWSARSYQYEINESQVSHMLVLEEVYFGEPNGLQRIVQNLRGQDYTHILKKQIVGYAGLWRIDEEAHISTIATHPSYRGKSYGELIFASLIRKSMLLGAEYMILEVRTSNLVAQNLYLKYGFQTVNQRSGYYRDGEDAYEMRVNFNNPDFQHRFDELFSNLHQHILVQDEYSESPHP